MKIYILKYAKITSKKLKKNSGKYNNSIYLLNKVKGIYVCSCCNNYLFSSKNIYDSKSGWPAFTINHDINSVLVIKEKIMKLFAEIVVHI